MTKNKQILAAFVSGAVSALVASYIISKSREGQESDEYKDLLKKIKEKLSKEFESIMNKEG
jgi:hypothetical protein